MVVSQGNDAACPFMPRFVNLPQANFCGGLPLAGIRNFPFLLIDEVGVFLVKASTDYPAVLQTRICQKARK